MNTVGDGSNGYPITPMRPYKKWVGLTEGETVEIALNAFALPEFPLEARLQLQSELVTAMNTPDSRMMMFAALIEAKLEEKNGG